MQNLTYLHSSWNLLSFSLYTEYTREEVFLECCGVFMLNCVLYIYWQPPLKYLESAWYLLTLWWPSLVTAVSVKSAVNKRIDMINMPLKNSSCHLHYEREVGVPSNFWQVWLMRTKIHIEIYLYIILTSYYLWSDHWNQSLKSRWPTQQSLWLYVSTGRQ